MHELASPAKDLAQQSTSRHHAPQPPSRLRHYSGNQVTLRRLSSVAPRIQAKLQVGATNDPLEAEADQVADRVMRMTDASVAARDSAPAVRRACPACQKEEEDDKVQRKESSSVVRRMCPECKKEEEDKQQSVQRKSATVGNAGGPAPQSVEKVLNSPGHPLPASDRAFFEPRFGADLSHILVHTDAPAQESAHSVNALAYTYGPHIVFAPGQFSPQSQQGKRLLAHELTHTLQQSAAGGSARRSLQRTGTSSTPAADTNEPEQSPVKRQSDTPEVNRAEAKSGALGDSLPSPVRKQMESRFGMDLSGVPVHTDAAAAGEAKSIGARAFTRNRELYFAQGRYNPNSSSGQALIAHELTHVAQQRQGRADLKGNLADLGKIAAANSRLEGEASANAAGFQESKNRIAVSDNATAVVRRSGPADNAPAVDPAAVDPAAANPAVADPAAKDPAVVAPDQNGAAPASTMGDAWDAVTAAAKGGLQAVADFIAEKFAATDAVIGQLNDLRKAIMSAGKSVVLSQGTVAQAASIYNAIASYIPSWLPAPELRFGPVQPFIIIIAGVALGAAELALIVAFFLCMFWLLLRANPGTRKAQDKAIQDFIDKIKEDLKPKEEETPKKEPDEEPKKEPDKDPKKPDDPPPPLPGPPDMCFLNMGLVPDASGSRWVKQRSPITKDGLSHITVSDAAFRLDKNFDPPTGQDASPEASKWVRSIGMPEDDAGHVIANRLGGTTEFNGPKGNIFPQDLSQNRGGMRVLDDLAKKKHDAGCDVCVHIGLTYPSSTALRPDSTVYTIQTRCGGGFDPPITTQIPNETAKRPAP
jgi:hypothetical protein